MKLKSNPFLRNLFAAATLGFGLSAYAADGTWNADTTPLFWRAADTGNWASGAVADGSGFTANFTNNITGDRVVNIDADKTITNIVFGDSDTTTAGSWTIANNGGSTNNLILAGATPTITVNALGATKTATISAIIEGSAGLTKAGVGTLVLSGTNTYSGETNISEGKLQVASNVIGSSSTIKIGNGATLETTGTGTFVLAANQAILGTGTTGFATTIGLDKGVSMIGTNTISTSGTLTFTRLNATGTTSNQISGGKIESGGSGSSQRGLVIGSGANGTLTISNATFTSKGINTGNQFDILGNGAGNTGTLIVDSGGSYVNTLNKLSLGNTNASGTLTINNGGTAIISEIDFNAGATASAIVNLNNGGTLTLSKITSNAGATRAINFDGGQFIAGASLPAFSGLTLNVKNGGAKINTQNNSFTISDALLNFSGATTASLTKSGAGTLTLSSVGNTYGGDTIVSEGTLKATNSGALPNFGTFSKVSVANAATLALNYGGVSDWTSTNVDNLLSANGAGFASGSTLALDTTNLSGSYTSNITDADLSLTKLGANILTLSGNNSYTGATTVSTGVLNVQHANALGTTAAGTTVASGAAIELQGGNISYATEALSIDGVGATGSGTTSNGALRNVSGSNTWNGNITVGTQNISRIGADTGSTLTIAGDVNLTGAAATTQTTLQGDGTIIINGKISGTGQLSSSSTGNLGVRTLTNNTNDYSSKTNLNGGRLRVGANGALGTSTVVFNGGTISSDGTTARSIANALSITGSVVLGNSTDNGKLTFTNLSTLTAGGGRTWTTNSDAEFQMNIDHTAGTMTKNGIANLILAGGGTLARLDITGGKLMIKSGNYTLNSFLTLNNTTSATYEQIGGDVSMTNMTQAAYAANANGAVGTFTVSGGSFGVASTNGLRFGAYTGGSGSYNVSGSGSIISTTTGGSGLYFDKTSGTATFNLGDGSSFSGGSSIHDGGTSGTLTVNKITRNAGAGTFNFNGGTLKASENNITFLGDNTNIAANVLAGGGIIDNNTFNITIGQNLLNGGGTDGGMVFKGSGKTTLTGTSTYTGATMVSAGTLSVNGSLASSTTVKNAAILKGIGSLAGTTTIESGGILAPGNSPGVITTDVLTLNSGSIFEWELDTNQSNPEINPETSRGLAYDAVNANTLTTGSGAIFKIALTGTQTFTDTFWDSARTWTDIFKKQDGSILSNWTDAFKTSETANFQYSYNGQRMAPTTQGYFTITGTSLNWTAVPEPTSALAGLLITAGLLRRRREVGMG